MGKQSALTEAPHRSSPLTMGCSCPGGRALGRGTQRGAGSEPRGGGPGGSGIPGYGGGGHSAPRGPSGREAGDCGLVGQGGRLTVPLRALSEAPLLAACASPSRQCPLQLLLASGSRQEGGHGGTSPSGTAQH